MNVHDLLKKMERAEKSFLESQFLAPLLPGTPVQVRIAGVVCQFKVKGKTEPGWAILKPLSMDTAKVVARPGIAQIHTYLSLFPALGLILITKSHNEWLALPARSGDSRFQIQSTVPVRLVTGAEPFDQIIARYDGSHFWFQEKDRRRNPAIAAYLRGAFKKETAPDKIRKPTLTAEERKAYQLLYNALFQARRDKVEIELTKALDHAGASLTSYIEGQDTYTVTFNVDGTDHCSVVQKNDLTVVVAGICLEGQDRNFDLQSLVSVIREGNEKQYIYSTNDYYDE